jgi:hypothetical protein
MEHRGLRIRLTRVIEQFEHGCVSTDEFKSAVSLACTLDKLMEIFAKAYALALTHGKDGIAQIIRRVNIDGESDSTNAQLELEPWWELWEPFVSPLTERKIDEWFSSPQEAKLIVIAKVESLGDQLEDLKARLNVGAVDFAKLYSDCCIRLSENSGALNLG